jgi:hypothetical protein
MKMGTAQKQNIAVQHRYFNKHPQNNIERPSFEQVFVSFIKAKQTQGIEFLFLEQQLIRVQEPGKDAVIRTLEYYRKQYEARYPEVIFEENGGLGESPSFCEVTA